MFSLARQRACLPARWWQRSWVGTGGRTCGLAASATGSKAATGFELRPLALRTIPASPSGQSCVHAHTPHAAQRTTHDARIQSAFWAAPSIAAAAAAAAAAALPQEPRGCASAVSVRGPSAQPQPQQLLLLLLLLHLGRLLQVYHQRLLLRPHRCRRSTRLSRALVDGRDHAWGAPQLRLPQHRFPLAAAPS